MELSVDANDTSVVGVACSGPAVVLSEPESSGDLGIMVLSGTSDKVELAGRAMIPWKKLMVPKRAAKRRVVDGILY